MRAAEVKIPASTKGKSQLTAVEMESRRNLAHLQIHVEQIIRMLYKEIKCSEQDFSYKVTVTNKVFRTGLFLQSY